VAQARHELATFAEYISTVLLPYINELRSNEEFADKEALLLMDNCSIHVQAKTLPTLAGHRVKVITFLPHTTHIFQCLDLSLFGNFEQKKNCEVSLENDEHTAGFIKRIFHLMKQTLVEDNVRSALMQLGLQYIGCPTSGVLQRAMEEAAPHARGVSKTRQGNSKKVGCGQNLINCSKPFPCPLSLFGKMT
jgi:hypothetical protein